MTFFKITFSKRILHDARNIGHLHITVFVRKLTIYYRSAALIHVYLIVNALCNLRYPDGFKSEILVGVLFVTTETKNQYI